jgi:PAS domain S-box-containing protein
VAACRPCEQEWSEHERLAAEGRLTAVLAASPDGMVVMDGDGIIRLFNAGASAMFGHGREEVLGQSIGILMPAAAAVGHDAKVAAFARSGVASRPMSSRGRLVARRKDGSEFPVEISIARSGEGANASFVATVRDVTEQVRTMAELERARQEAVSAAAAKGAFLANMSHEIRTPMNAVIGLTGILLDSDLTADQRDMISTIRTSGDQLLTLINDILDYSKIESGKLDLERVPVELRDCVESSVDLLAPRANEKRLELLSSIADGVPEAILGDATRLRQILVNLVSNAVKFTASGEVVVEATSSLDAQGARWLRLDVRDTGMGIPADRVQKLFQSFSQLDASTTRQFGGTGLGLAISRRLAEQMGGTLTVASEPGRGSTFTVAIPVEVADLPIRLHDPRLPALEGRRILLVDDNVTNLRILERLLGGWKAVTVCCRSGEDALAVVSRDPGFDVAVLDLHMPGMDGVDVARALRGRLGGRCPRLVLYSSVGERLTGGDDALFDVVLFKPARSGQILRALAGAVAAGAAASSDLTPGARLADRCPLRILLAEDNPVNQKVAERMLTRMGYRIDIVSDGREAVEAVRARPYDIVLMDVQMPVLDGLEATRELRARPLPAGKLPRIVAMTASAMESDRKEAFRAGMDDFVSKPVRVQDLEQVLLRAAPSAAA